MLLPKEVLRSCNTAPTKHRRYSHHPPALKVALENVRHRYQQVVEQNLQESNVVSTLIVMAALEEALQSSLQQQQQLEEAQSAAGTSTSKRSSSTKPHPPLYYSANPSSYLQAPSSENGEAASSSGFPKTQMTPTVVLAQRVRHGCQWAWTLLQSQQPKPPLLAALIAKRFTEGTIVANVENPLDAAAIAAASMGGTSVAQRRSVRAVRVTSYAEDADVDTKERTRSVPGSGEPNPVQKGGRIAMWWLKELEDRENGTKDEEAIDEQEDDGDVQMEIVSPIPAKAKNGKSNSATKKGRKPENDGEVSAQPFFRRF